MASQEVTWPMRDSRLTPVPRLPSGFDTNHMASLDADGGARSSRRGTAIAHPHGSGWV